MGDNFWMGAEKLTITYMNGTHVVLSSWEDEPLFMGTYNACREYCTTREAEYLESIIRCMNRRKQMTRKQIHDLLDITLDVNGLEPRQAEETGDKPTAFFQFSGHVANVTVQVCKNGWEPYAPYDINIEFKTDKPCSQSEIESLREKALSTPAPKEADPQAVAYLDTMIEHYNDALLTAQAAHKFNAPDIRERLELVAKTTKNLIDKTFGEDAYVTRLDGQMIRLAKGGEHVTD